MSYRRRATRGAAGQAGARRERGSVLAAEHLYVNIDRATGRPTEVPPAVRAILERELAASGRDEREPAASGHDEAPAPAPLRVYLEIGRADGWCLVHCPDLPGAGFKAPSREAALALAPGRLSAELDWLARARPVAGWRLAEQV
ncbi:MAG: hypothetical protein K6U08_10330, partial [Firmicutes bacterium]|nr:hypothetical protein [Bacillota bacterium]